MKKLKPFVRRICFAGLVTVCVAHSAASAESPASGGVLRLWLQAWPKGLNYLTSNDGYSHAFNQLVHITLVDRDQESWKGIPYLAESWKMAPDKRTYTFKLFKQATWPDGKPITAEDVKYSIDLINDPKRCTLCEPVRSYVGPVEETKVIDPQTFMIRMKNVHWENAERIGENYYIMPKHILEGKDFNKDFEKEPAPGGGPYYYDASASKMRKEVVIKRRKNWWANSLPIIKDRYNFDEVHFRYIEDPTVAWEAFKRGEIDIFNFNLLTIQFWDNRSGAPYNNPDLKTITAPQLNPYQQGGIALNMRKGVLSDLRFRKALQYLFNRDLIISKVLHNHFVPIYGPHMPGTPYASGGKPTPYDPKKAAELLKEAGFTRADSDGILYRGDHERASVRVIYATDAHGQWLTIFKEDAKKAGVEIIPRKMDWSSAMKLLDEFNYEGFVITWVGDPVPGNEQLFHGKSANVKGSSNLPGLNDPKINQLIDDVPKEFNLAKRAAQYRETENLIVEQQPYVFRWTDKEHLVAYWKSKVDPTSKPFFKFSGTDTRYPFWYHWRKAK